MISGQRDAARTVCHRVSPQHQHLVFAYLGHTQATLRSARVWPGPLAVSPRTRRAPPPPTVSRASGGEGDGRPSGRRRAGRHRGGIGPRCSRGRPRCQGRGMPEPVHGGVAARITAICQAPLPEKRAALPTSPERRFPSEPLTCTPASPCPPIRSPRSSASAGIASSGCCARPSAARCGGIRRPDRPGQRHHGDAVPGACAGSDR